jgi:hypothetical protein
MEVPLIFSAFLRVPLFAYSCLPSRQENIFGTTGTSCSTGGIRSEENICFVKFF